jgi:hypothetical protein
LVVVSGFEALMSSAEASDMSTGSSFLETTGAAFLIIAGATALAAGRGSNFLPTSFTRDSPVCAAAAKGSTREKQAARAKGYSFLNGKGERSP